MNACDRFKKRFYGLSDIRTLNYQADVWLDDIIIVTRGDKEKCREKLFKIPEQIQEAWYRASESISEFFFKKITWPGHEITEHGIKPNKKTINLYYY